jgi:hypothetical protein
MPNGTELLAHYFVAQRVNMNIQDTGITPSNVTILGRVLLNIVQIMKARKLAATLTLIP